MTRREILHSIAIDFKREGQTQQDFLTGRMERSAEFLSEYAAGARARGFVIGISGGLDSFVAAGIAALCAKKTGLALEMMLLPCGEQRDLADAQACAQRVQELYTHARISTVNIGGGLAAARDALAACEAFGGGKYALGNVQARLRMAYQYAVAQDGLLVLGTDHATENITGYFTKYGDGGTDVNPIDGMVKDDLYDLARMLGAPACVLEKAPAAGLGISASDEDELGIAYSDICAYLKGFPVSEAVEARLEGLYRSAVHKRNMPASPLNDWWKGSSACTLIVREGANAEDTLSFIRDFDPIVLYAGQWDGAYLQLPKAINTPLPHYNVFTGDGGWQAYTNSNYGALCDNLTAEAYVSGADGIACVQPV